MSLGAFFRDYVYIPLRGNRRWQLRNIAVVWLLTGLWHGAAWNFLLWGAYFGVLLIAEKYVISKIKLRLPNLLRRAATFFIVLLGWVVFYGPNMAAIGKTFMAMFSYRAPVTLAETFTARQGVFFLCLCVFAATPLAKTAYDRLLSAFKREKRRELADSLLSAAYTLAVLAVSTILLAGASFSPFLYYRF